MSVRPAGPGDAEAMAAIHEKSFPRGWSAGEMRTLLSGKGATGVIDSAGGGFALGCVVAGESEILSLAVDPDRRRAGLGRALLAALEAQCAAAGSARMVLDVSETNAAARALYAAAGYGEAARRKAYYADGADALILDKQLR